jgi:hypothetical protein
MGILNKLFGAGTQTNSTINTIPENWTVLQSQNDGKPMLIRKNALNDSIIAHKSYNVRCGIAFEIKHPNDNGMPQMEKEPELNAMEDQIFDSFEKDQNSIIALILTTSGFREFVVYTKDINDFERNLKVLRQNFAQYELTSYHESDPGWKLYKNYR